ncbi:MAG: hypothetical protein KDA88_08635 [Planctomycetaceae bacterium]|nr:hypothetical protein [Planctomycetaceae bacterium]MCB9952982.1 hypothetical protein [Planctomycetaceae bacterium]
MTTVITPKSARILIEFSQLDGMERLEVISAIREFVSRTHPADQQAFVQNFAAMAGMRLDKGHANLNAKQSTPDTVPAL